MNCLTATDGVLVIFDQQEQHQMFKEFKNKQNIHCLFWNDDWVEKDKNLGKNVAVVYKKYEQQVIKFYNDCDCSI